MYRQYLVEWSEWLAFTQKVGGSRLGESLIRKSSKRAKLTLAANFSDLSTTP